MLQVLIPSPTPRVLYALELVFTHVLGVEYQWVAAKDYHPEGEHAVIDYAGAGIPGAFGVPSSGLLSNHTVEELRFSLTFEGGSPILFASEEVPPGSLSFDVFAAAFYLATEYEKWVLPRYDAHGRYDEQSYLSYLQGWHRQPLVHVYAERLWQALESSFPFLQRRPRNFDFHLTFDIDHPWKYLHKKPWVTLGGMGRRMWQGQWHDLGEQIRVLRSGKDPYDTFSLIFQHCPPEKTTFFFLGGGQTAFDSRFSFGQKAVQQYIHRAQDLGYGIGLHPSYATWEDAMLLEQEKKALEAIVQTPVERSRQHFLRYRHPLTFRNLIKAGIKEDYTLAFYSDLGFRTHLAVPYPWFDLEANEATSLMLHPTLAMDRTLQHYLQLGPDEGLQRLQDLRQQVEAIGGVFTLLLHNDALSESGEWKGWRGPLLGFIDSLTGKKPS